MKRKNYFAGEKRKRTADRKVVDLLSSISQYARFAEAKLIKNGKEDILSWINSGAETGSTLENNLRALESITIYQRPLQGISNSDIECDFFGRRASAPIFAAPMSGLDRIYSSSQVDVIRACSELNLPCFIGHFPGFSPEDLVSLVSKISLNVAGREYKEGGPSEISPLIWMSYVTEGQEEKVLDLASKAKSLGFSAFGITVDAPTTVKLGDVVQEWYSRHPRQVAVSFDQVRRLRRKTDLPFVVKGITHKDDARLAIEAGANAIVVSNHGGRILDCMPATVDVLPEIVRTVNGAAKVYVDGGFRRGTDIFKALALGADAVLIGRPIAWGLVLAKMQGVMKVLNTLVEELKRTCWLAGFDKATDVDDSAIRGRKSM